MNCCSSQSHKDLMPPQTRFGSGSTGEREREKERERERGKQREKGERKRERERNIRPNQNPPNIMFGSP